MQGLGGQSANNESREQERRERGEEIPNGHDARSWFVCGSWTEVASKTAEQKKRKWREGCGMEGFRREKIARPNDWNGDQRPRINHYEKWICEENDKWEKNSKTARVLRIESVVKTFPNYSWSRVKCLKAGMSIGARDWNLDSNNPNNPHFNFVVKHYLPSKAENQFDCSAPFDIICRISPLTYSQYSLPSRMQRERHGYTSIWQVPHHIKPVWGARKFDFLLCFLQVRYEGNCFFLKWVFVAWDLTRKSIMDSQLRHCARHQMVNTSRVQGYIIICEHLPPQTKRIWPLSIYGLVKINLVDNYRVSLEYSKSKCRGK